MSLEEYIRKSSWCLSLLLGPALRERLKCMCVVLNAVSPARKLKRRKESKGASVAGREGQA